MSVQLSPREQADEVRRTLDEYRFEVNDREDAAASRGWAEHVVPTGSLLLRPEQAKLLHEVLNFPERWRWTDRENGLFDRVLCWLEDGP